MSNISSSSVVYWALNNYGVTIFDIIVNIIVLTIASWIITLNVIVLKVLYDKENKDPSEYFIINLASADLLTGLYLIHNTVYNFSNFQNLTECLLRFGFGMSVTISSVFQLVALSMDRYFKIMKPFRYGSICNRGVTITVTIISWSLAVIIGLLPVCGWQQPLDNHNFCGLMKIITIGYFDLLVVVFLVPFFLLLVTYIRIFKEARRHATSISCSYPGSESKTTRHSLKFTKTVFIVVGTYFICWVPMGTVVVLHVRGQLNHLSYIEKGNLLVYASALAFINSLLNPIIYAFKMPLIKRRFRQVFCRKRVHTEDVTMYAECDGNVISGKNRVSSVTEY
ncbi:hypothetical protein LOTGIDRAFT_152121 [Lottia gigantea]|uniref:G-protein coupled receptors family 1 profile domain-containing protein n=1 Tax=Lottia gigantea TaxID=225164 RepID=V4CRY6_LOTGI|nr:hypothetical protein LOTGIDRAFT_152121 [Lottia gigantea]ESP05290.1 hypothetical protein LOTGIDRAFT_152121 [Lottia gigantea]